MSFTYPFALFALLAIPVLIIIYILRNKYRDETAPSTYLWELSEKFLKKKNPLRKIEHLLSLIIQILAIAGMSFALAHPVFTVKEGADNYVFVLDASASMNMVNQESKKDRFSLAKDDVSKVIQDSNLGSTFTIILAESEPRIVCKAINDKSRAQLYLDTLSAGYGSSTLDQGLNMAQELFSNGTCNVCYLATDKSFSKTAIDQKETLQNINFIDVSDNTAINYAITEFNYSYSIEDGKNYLNYSGKVINYNDKNKDVSLKVRFYVDDKSTGFINVESKKDGSGKVTEEFTEGQEFAFSVKQEDTEKKYSSGKEIKAVIENSDSMPEDNTMIYYNTSLLSTTKVLYIAGSDAKIYMKAALSSITSTGTLEITTTSSYSGQTGYDIYVFDSVSTISTLPATGALWFVNCANIESDDLGFRVGDRRSGLDVTMKYSDNKDDTLYNEFTKTCTTGKEFPLSQYIRYSITGDFTSVLSYDNIPLVFAGKSDSGRREAVFAFPLDCTNLALTYDFVSLVRNFINYSNPTLLKQFTYEAKEKATFSLSELVSNIRITTPKKKEEPLDISGKEYVEYTFDEVGSYKIEVSYSDNTKKEVSVYASYPKEEQDPFVEENKNYNLVMNVNTKKGDGLFDNILPFVIVAAVVFALDWIVYAHEQY